jgi:hypothetical protein
MVSRDSDFGAARSADLLIPERKMTTVMVMFLLAVRRPNFAFESSHIPSPGNNE